MRRALQRLRRIQLSWQKIALGWGVILVVLGFLFLWQMFFRAHSQWIPAPGGIYTESTIGTTRNLSPLSSESSLLDHDLQALIFAGLLRYNPTSGQIEDSLADFRLSEDSKTYFLTLKNSARFSNGDPVTTEDIIFTFERIIQNPNFENEILQKAFEYVSIDVVDERTLAFHLPEPNVFFPSLLTTPILHAKSFKNALIEEITDPDHPGNKHPIGAGPFRLKNIVPSNEGGFRVFLTRNKHYYRKSPYLDQIVFYVYPSFEHLKLTHTWTTMFSQIPFRELEGFEKNLFGEYIRREYVLPRLVAVFFNLDRTPIDNTYLRRALKWALDKDKVLEKEPGWNRIDSIFFFEGVEDWHETDAAEARKLLRDRGFKYDKEREIRIFDNKNVELRMITSTSPPVYSRFAQTVARTWEKELNIAVKVEVLEPNKFQLALKNRDYDIVLFGQSFSENFDSLSTWHSSQSGQLNLANLTNDDVDFLIDEVRFSGGQSDLFVLNQKLAEIVPAVVFATPQYYLLTNQKLSGFSETFGKVRRHADRFADVYKWYFFQQRDWDWDEEKSKTLGFIRWIFGIEE